MDLRLRTSVKCNVQCTVCVEVDRLKLSSLEIQEILLPLTLVLTLLKGNTDLNFAVVKSSLWGEFVHPSTWSKPCCGKLPLKRMLTNLHLHLAPRFELCHHEAQPDFHILSPG